MRSNSCTPLMWYQRGKRRAELVEDIAFGTSNGPIFLGALFCARGVRGLDDGLGAEGPPEPT